MNKDKASSWIDIFRFTFMQQLKSKSFKIATLLIGAITFTLILAVLFFTGRDSDHEEDMQGIENINQVYILDTTKEFKDINMYIDSYEDISEVHPDFTKIEFKEVDGEMNLSDAMEDISAEDDRLLIHIERQEDGILLQALLPEETLINEDESWELVDKLSQIIETYKKANSELTGEQIMAISKPIIPSVALAGEDPLSFEEQIINFFIPYLYSFILYFLLLIYGQTMMNSLMVEKTSKLTEMLLTSVKPKFVVAGKILATSTVAILQFLFWIICAIAGFIVGVIVVQSQNAKYLNPVVEIVEMVQKNTDGFGFSALSIILSIIALCLGFLFYFSIAGIIGSTLSKAEDVSSGIGLFTLPVIIFGMMSIMVPTFVEGFWLKILNYFPFTSAFILPANILIGNISTSGGIISIAILLISIIIAFILSGKLYKGLIFFKGEKLSFKNIVLAFKKVE